MFIQMIGFSSTRREDVLGLAARWSRDAVENGTASAAWLCADRDNDGTWRWMVQFPSYDAAMQNSQRFQTDVMSREFASLCDDGPTFRNLDVVRSDP